MKIDKLQLQEIFDRARNNVLDLSPNQGGLDQQQFITKCYLLAFNSVLKLNMELEFPVKSVPEPVED